MHPISRREGVAVSRTNDLQNARAAPKPMPAPINAPFVTGPGRPAHDSGNIDFPP